MTCLKIGVLGINFKTGDLALREAVARAAVCFSDQRAIFFPHPTVLLSTCNRTEIYFSADDLAAAHSDLLAYLRLQFEHRLYSYFGIDCFAHLCRVASGLESAIFAETEIQRQVKMAYLRSKGHLPSCMHYAFQKALKVGKEVRNRADQGPMLYGTLWKMADWRKGKVLLVGNSEINRGFASFLTHKKVPFTLCTRNPEGAHAVDRSELDRWQQYDLIVCASKAEGFLITGQGRGQVIFDLSVPRNVDPAVGETTRLYNIDQLMQGERRDGMLEELVWEHVIRLAQIYRFKNRHALETGEKESHLLCSPCLSRIRQAARTQDQIPHGERIHILGAQGTTNSPGG
jgi:glutamyl-tRNA reductase